MVSRILKTLARTNTSENPVVSIIARLLTMRVNNGAVIYRLSVAKQKGYMSKDENIAVTKGYTNLRHCISNVIHLAALLVI